jgi:periplasmic copper chaperone A
MHTIAKVNLNHAALYHGDSYLPAAHIASMKRRAFLYLMAIPTLAHAHSYKLGNIAIGHAWGLPSKDGETQIFMPLLNSGTEEDSLVAASFDQAKTIELRLNSDYTMPAETAFVLTPKKPMPMRPTARHIRLMGLTKPLLAGERIELTLKFAKSGETKIEVHIQDKAGE